ncbi:MAG TPA: hypothetical protein VF816_09275 [Rhodocyclaceae bacterium]
MKTLKTVHPLTDRRAVKPRNPVLAALAANKGAHGGAHGKTRGAVRRAEKKALQREIAAGD